MHSDPATSSPATTWQGRYSDGRTANSVPADVRLTDRGVEIGFAGAPSAMVWPYGALATGTPITKQAQDALLTYSYMPGATLFVPDADFTRAVIKSAPQLTAAAYGWRSARPWLYAAAAVALVSGGVWASDLSVTAGLARLMPDHLRRSVGEQVISSMTSGKAVCDAPAGRAALDRLVERLSAASGTKTKFQVKVVDWSLLNAFAAPGEQIVLTREIIRTSKSPDEVAGVLAHEMGHGLHLHPESGIIRVIGMTAAVELMLGGSGGTIAGLGLALTQIGYTRSAEREADARGYALLQKAEISTAGVIDFFKRMETVEKKMGAPEWDILRTHPQSQDRAKAAAAVPKYPSTPAMSAADWQALRTICGPDTGPGREPDKPATTPERTTPPTAPTKDKSVPI